jgi:transposase
MLEMQKENTKQIFNGQSFFVGIDVHKKNWTVTIRTNQMELKTFSMNPSPEELIRYLNEHYPGGEYYSVYESGFCGYWISKALLTGGVKSIIVNAADIPTKSKEKITKSDVVDSRKLARELESGTIRGIYIPDEVEEQIRTISRLRFGLVAQGSALKNRIKGLLNYYGENVPENYEVKNWSNRFIEYLRNDALKNKAISKVSLDFLMDELIDNQERIKKVLKQMILYSKEYGYDTTIKNLTSIPGVSTITALTIYSEIMNINRFEGLDELASFVGLVPAVYSSGDKEKILGLSERHNRYLRYMLIESAWVAVRKDPALTLKYSELIRRMSKQEAIIRIAKKLLNRIRFVWKNNLPYSFALVA